MTENQFWRQMTAAPLVVPALAGAFALALQHQEQGGETTGAEVAAFTIAIAGAYSAVPYLLFLTILHVFIRPCTHRAWNRTLWGSPLLVALGVAGYFVIAKLWDKHLAEVGALVTFWAGLALITGYAYAVLIWGCSVWFRRNGWIRPTVLTLAVSAIAPAMTAGAQAPAAAQTTASTFAVPQWAFPTAPARNPPLVPDSVTKHRLPQSSRSFTQRAALNAYDLVDWFPTTHPEMPVPVRHGRRPEPRACGYCHLPDGAGRPENATVAGLPADYIARQVAAIRDGTRLAANPKSTTNSMHLVAKGATDAEVAEAAAYFSSLRLTRRNRVVETAHLPRTRVEGNLYVYDGQGTEPIDGRLIEVPDTFERHELHDPRVIYTTYVPRGSLARGRRLAANGPTGSTTACATCHGPRLLGVTPAPPIAGRSPSYLLRQLLNFRSGARRNDGSALMQPVVSELSIDDMVALAAYVGSLAPSARAAKAR